MKKTMVFVVEPELDERIQKLEMLIVRYDNATLIDTNFTDSFQFPALKMQVYIEDYVKEGDIEASQVHAEFKGIKR